MTKRRGLSLKDALENFSSGHSFQGNKEIEEIKAAWSAMVGVDCSSCTRPRSLENGVLHVQVDSPAWSTKIRMESRHILASIRDEFGLSAKKVVTRVRSKNMAPEDLLRLPLKEKQFSQLTGDEKAELRKTAGDKDVFGYYLTNIMKKNKEDLQND